MALWQVFSKCSFRQHSAYSWVGMDFSNLVRFGSVFNIEYPVLLFFRFQFLQITAKSAMKAHAVGKTCKGSEAVYAFTPHRGSAIRPTTNVYNRAVNVRPIRYLKAPTVRTVESRKRPPLFSD